MRIVEAIVPQKVTDARTVVMEGTAHKEGRIRKANLCYTPGCFAIVIIRWDLRGGDSISL